MKNIYKLGMLILALGMLFTLSSCKDNIKETTSMTDAQGNTTYGHSDGSSETYNSSGKLIMKISSSGVIKYYN